MATITKTGSGLWKAQLGANLATIIKTYGIRIVSEDWVRITEDLIIRSIYVPSNDSRKLTVSRLRRCLANKPATTQDRGKNRIKQLKSALENNILPSMIAELDGLRLKRKHDF